MGVRPEQKMPVIPFPQTHDKDPKGGPLWMRWVRGSAQVLADFELYIGAEVNRIREQYAQRITAGQDVNVLAGYEQALKNLLDQVKLYEVEEKANVAFREKTGQR